MVLEQVSHELHDGGGLSQQWPLCHIKIKHLKSAGGQCVPVPPAAIVRVSGAPALTAAPALSLVRIITVCLLKHLVSQNPLLLQNQQAEPVLLMSVIPASEEMT